jgi:hypothetical protein
MHILHYLDFKTRPVWANPVWAKHRSPFSILHSPWGRCTCAKSHVPCPISRVPTSVLLLLYCCCSIAHTAVLLLLCSCTIQAPFVFFVFFVFFLQNCSRCACLDRFAIVRTLKSTYSKLGNWGPVPSVPLLRILSRILLRILRILLAELLPMRLHACQVVAAP